MTEEKQPWGEKMKNVSKDELYDNFMKQEITAQYFSMDGQPPPLMDASKGYLMFSLKRDGSVMVRLHDGEKHLDCMSTLDVLQSQLNMVDMFTAFSDALAEVETR